MNRHKNNTNILHILFFSALAGFFLMAGFGLIWVSSLRLPNLDSFDERKIASSTKIYDRTEKIVLFDINENIKRTVIPADQISSYAKNAAVAIEDDQFYQHNGIDIRGTARGIFYSLLSVTGIREGNLQGGSTITQQVVKNALLTSERNLTRKLKEWFLAIKLEQKYGKDEILAQYLNIIPYGGTMYGIEEASRTFFGKSASEITLAESAYLAALPNAPTFYSPYGQNKDKLENRKNLVLRRMHELNFITPEEYEGALDEEVVFLPRENSGAQALHFVEYVRGYLENKYGTDAIESGGLKVVTTLDADLQAFTEKTVAENSQINEEQWEASNQGVLVINPNSGEILTMVGSRDYFDQEIDGSFNVTLAKRQPGSAFKPFVYVSAFEKGYTPDTVIFDTRTQFSASCDIFNFSSEGDCYSPQNYDGIYKGPMKLRNALAESRNVVAVKLLYLVGIQDASRTAKDFGITTLTDADRYGLTLVLGGGEVSLLDMTSAYGVFATGGLRTPPFSILRVEDRNGNILEENRSPSQRVIDEQSVALLNDILSDNEARIPLFQTRNNYLYFGENRDVAGKTGTTNNNRDAWLIGYSPDVVVGVWTGNNDNTPMQRGSAISGPTFRSVMEKALQKTPNTRFTDPLPEENPQALKPVLRGEWKGGESVWIDSISKKLATERTPAETREEVVIPDPHTILHWVNRNDPRGPIPEDPSKDSQYLRWELPVQQWIQQNASLIGPMPFIPQDEDDVHTILNEPVVKITSPTTTSFISLSSSLEVEISVSTRYPIRDVSYFYNGIFAGSAQTAPYSFTFIPDEIADELPVNEIKVVVTDTVYNRGEAILEIE